MIFVTRGSRVISQCGAHYQRGGNMPINGSRDKIEEIKNRLDIVDVIGKEIQLHHRGNGQYDGSVPPVGKSGKSLKVDKRLQLWNDTKNGKGGDVIDWIGRAFRDPKGNDFPAVIEVAAVMAGVELDHVTEHDRDAAKEKADIHNIFTDVVEIYHNNLTPELYDGINEKWGINKETVDNSKIGYATTSRDMKDLDKTTLKKSGLVYVNNGMMGGEVFSGRIIFPYWKNGKVVYLIGRATEETPKSNKDWSEPPKYQKLLVHKEGREYVSPSVQNSYFYGEDSLRGSDYCIITEGVADCIVMQQAGFPCISPVTVRFREKDHAKLISLVSGLKRVYICNDNEANGAGLEGALSTAEALEGAGIEARLVELPKSEGIDKIDIADYMKDHRKEDFKHLMDSSVGLWTYKLNTQVIPKTSTSLDRLRLCEQFVKELSRMKPNEREIFIENDVAEKFKLKAKNIRSIIAPPPAALKEGTPAGATKTRRQEREEGKKMGSRGAVLCDDLSDAFMEVHPVKTLEDGDLRIYGNGVYQTCKNKYTANNMMVEVAGDMGLVLTPAQITDALEMIKSKTPTEATVTPMHLIPVNNGVLNIRTMELEEYTPENVFLSKYPINYNPDAGTPSMFMEMIRTTFEGVEEQIPLIQEIFGYCFLRSYFIEALFFFVGNGGNGKTLLVNILSALLGGSEHCSYLTFKELSDPKNENMLCDLFGKSANICGDTGKQKLKETDTLKKATGNDYIRARMLYKEKFDFKNFAKVILLFNKLPEVDDFSDGFKRRLRIIEFPNQFKEGVEGTNKHLDREIIENGELDGVFLWALEGLKRLMKTNTLTNTQSTALRGLEYAKKSTPMYFFVRECIEEAYAGFVRKGELLEYYTKYAAFNRLPQLTVQEFKRELLKECKEIGIETGEKRSQRHTDRPYGFYNIKVDMEALAAKTGQVFTPSPVEGNIGEQARFKLFTPDVN